MTIGSHIARSCLSSRGSRLLLALVAIVCAGLASCSDVVPTRPAPDLVVTSPTVSDSGPEAGAQFTLSATVSNEGEGAAAATTLRYYRSTDTTITTSDTEVGMDAVAELAAAGSSSQSVELTAPSSPETYYYGVCVDAVTEESDTTNNCSASVQVTVPETEREPERHPERHPDLMVTSPTVSDSGPAAGETFTLSATVRNAGEGDAAATTLRYYRSADTTITASDAEVGMDAVAELAAAGSSGQSVELTASSSPGTYYYGACVEAVTEESDTTNNCSASVQVTVPETEREPERHPERHPDLVVTSPTVSDSGPAAGETFTLSATVRNAGEGDAAATTLRYYQSTDATITAGDTSVGMVAIAGLAGSGSSSQSVELTASSSPGTYYYGACVDAVPDETDTTNNCSASVPVTVPEPKRPDLVVTLPRVNDSGPAADADFTLSAAVRNDGEGTAAATTLMYYQSTDATITATDTLVGTVAIAGLAAAGSSSQSVDLTAPSRPGTYYYGGCVAPVPDETDTTNNCSASVPVTVPEPKRPDLVVTLPRVNDGGPAAGAEFTLSATVRNDGEGTAAGTTLSYYLSTDATITAADTSLETVAIAGLAGSGSSSQSVDLTAPSRPGTYYYGACVDPVPDETDTTNNCSTSVQVTVQVAVTEPQGHPDLVVESPSVNDSGPSAGAEFTLSAAVRNDGEGTAATTTLSYYQSTDATITATDTLVGTVAIAGLAAAGSSSQSVDLTAPSRPGTYYYGACVDPVTDETDTTNNCSASVPVTVPEPKRPDLAVTLPRVNDSGPAAGAEFTLSATVRNDGEGAAAGTTLSYYQSTDTTITAGDTSVGAVAIAGLAAAGSSSQSVDLTAPSSPGTYYYGACVDAVPDETDTTNNCSASVPVTVPEPKRPDLAVTLPRVNDSGPAAGAEFTLSATVRNDGEGAAAGTTLSYYQSTDTTITAGDTSVGAVAIAGLAAAGSSSQSVDLTAPSSPGTYYYGACVDAVPDETDTTNNCSASVPVTVPEPKRPDLAVTLPRVNDSGPAAGAEFTLSATVRNDGEGAAAGTTLSYYQSTDTTITAGDTSVGAVAIAGLAAAGSSSQSVDLTAPSSPGTYYYGACVAPVPDETDTTNNCSASVAVTVTPKSVEVTPGDVTFASLGATAELTARVLDAQDNEIFGQAVSWSSNFPEVATVNAAGVVTAVANGIATVTASASGVSGEATVTVWQRAASAAIDPGEVELTSVGGTATVTLRAFDANGHEAPDAGNITSWRWQSANPNVATVHPFLVIDPRAQVRAVGAGMTDVTVAAVTEDGVRLNATTEVTVTIPQYPDLEVETTVSDETPETGASFTLSATVSNTGDGESPATTLTYYQSTDATVTPADTPVGTDDVGVLSASGTSEQSISLTAPDSPATYYYGACVDAVADESDATNNCSDSVPVTVSEPEESALSVEISAEDDKEWAPVGDTVDLSARVLDDEGEEITGTTVTWSSSNIAVATVDSSGVMTAEGEGTVTLTATATVSASSTQSSMARSAAAVVKSDQTVTGSVRMIVVKRAARIDISPASLSFDSVGDFAVLTATVYDEDDNVMRPTYWGWSSADRAVATASTRVIGSQTQGSVTAIGEGTTTVSVSVNGSARGTASVTVTLPVARVEVSPIELDFEALGDTKTVTVRVLDENGDEDEGASFTAITVFQPCCDIEPGDPIETVHVAKVNDGLEVTARGTGSGRITISSGDAESAFVLVRVYQVAKSLTLSPDSASLAVGETATLRAAVMDANGNDIRLAEGLKGGRVVYWETSDPDVATVDGADHHPDRNTGATATVTAAAAGTATITGRHGGDVTGTATITVTDSS